MRHLGSVLTGLQMFVCRPLVGIVNSVLGFNWLSCSKILSKSNTGIQLTVLTSENRMPNMCKPAITHSRLPQLQHKMMKLCMNAVDRWHQRAQPAASGARTEQSGPPRW